MAHGPPANVPPPTTCDTMDRCDAWSACGCVVVRVSCSLRRRRQRRPAASRSLRRGRDLPPGMWINVTPPDIAAVLRPTANVFGPGSIAGDPARPSDIYVDDRAPALEVMDYGNSWTLINDTLPMSRAATSSRSRDDARHDLGGGLQHDLQVRRRQDYVRPDRARCQPLLAPGRSQRRRHLISGLHEADGIFESSDGGASWHAVGTNGFPSVSVSWYPFFIEAGDPRRRGGPGSRSRKTAPAPS